MSNNSSSTTGLPHSPPSHPFPYLTTPQSYYHNLPYSPSSSHSRQLSNLSCPPYNHHLTSSSANQNTPPPPVSSSNLHYPPPPTTYYPHPPASYPPPLPPLPPSFFPSYPSNIHSPITPSPLDQQALQAPSYYSNNWQDLPYPPSSPPYDPSYRPSYLAFRDAPPLPIDSPYPPPLAFSPTSSSHLQDSSYQRTYRHPSPLQSPYTSPGPHTPHNSFRSPSHPARHHSPRYPAFVHHHRPTFSSASSPPIYHHLHHDAKSPTNTSPPPPVSSDSPLLVRGSLAQAKLRNHHLIKRTPPQLTRQPFHPTTPPPKNSKLALHLQRPALPRPPSHSEHALWVGNVPNDASHEELWKFFTARTIPSSASSPTAGVESIHLISRSNCAFVNYISDQHLQFAIESCNGKSLRQFDPRCKNLVCRVRKIEDNVKSGVGAQRIGGMHRAWIKKMGHIKSITQLPQIINQTPEKETDHDDIKIRMGSTSTFHSSNGASSGSTTSSFLSKHFSRRYFILKSYTEDDLKLSIERQVWASQSHNEPILDQAYRTSPQGIYLIFSVNRSGEFYGYARMTGPIWRRPIIRPASVPNSPVSRPAPLALGLGLGGLSGGGTTGRRASVSGSLELHEALTGSSSLDDGIAGNSRVTTASPAPLSPSLRSGVGGAATGMLGLPVLPHISSSSSNARSLPEPITIKKYIHHHAHRQEVTEESQVQDQDDEDGDSVFSSGGNRHHHHHSARPFDVEWIKVQRLPFHLTRDLKNPFNGHREVKVSRDGTEIEPSIGAELLARIDAAAAAAATPSL